MTTVVLAGVLPVLAVWAAAGTVRITPVAVANLRARRRLLALSSPGSPSPPVRRPDPPRARRTPVSRSIDAHRRRRRDRTVPDGLDRIVRRLRSGSSLPHAIAAAGADHEVFEPLGAEVAAGRPLVAAVRRWRDAEPMPNRRLAATALELTASAGGASARVLDGVAESLRDRVALDREVTALSAQSRASAVLLVLAPLVFTLFVGAIDGRVLTTLFGTPLGWALLAAGVTLDVVGAWWMSRLLDRHR